MSDVYEILKSVNAREIEYAEIDNSECGTEITLGFTHVNITMSTFEVIDINKLAGAVSDRFPDVLIRIWTHQKFNFSIFSGHNALFINQAKSIILSDDHPFTSLLTYPDSMRFEFSKPCFS